MIRLISFHFSILLFEWSNRKISMSSFWGSFINLNFLG